MCEKIRVVLVSSYKGCDLYRIFLWCKDRGWSSRGGGGWGEVVGGGGYVEDAVHRARVLGPVRKADASLRDAHSVRLAHQRMRLLVALALLECLQLRPQRGLKLLDRRLLTLACFGDLSKNLLVLVCQVHGL